MLLLIIAGLIAALLAAVLHGFIFYIESFAWTTKGITVFGLTAESAEQTKEMAYNQGFYNLFLGIIAAVGAAFYVAGSHAVGLALMCAGTGAMLTAALVLFCSSPDKRSAAVKQGFLPLLAILFLTLGTMI